MGYKVAPYISFADGAAEALEFYRSVLGGTVSIMRFGDLPNPDLDPADADKVMHGQLDLDNGFALMASDSPTGMEHDEGQRVSVTLFGDDGPELGSVFEKLAEGGSVVEPYTTAPWGDSFGMLIDRYGVFWMLNASGGEQG
ncbi:VOC family protein [Microbacterium stercoris]|uniref:VOC family protein n=1 Tax=Microbacterium stercoris TaxID=2820289 RepID=A0A939TYU9_9MICO|nr:VOC family protein [Microbacterium stercoris]MBO3665087.1 VOC family protein [Microbacterium stercoris]